jgi:cbb3-type cytochrome oxidase cytochrome c subunit
LAGGGETVNFGPIVFLGAFFALAASWFGMILVPQVQLGRLQPTNSIPAGAAYPVARPGLAQQGLEIYRANGCASCHTTQVGQGGTVCDVVIAEAGTNQPALVAALASLRNGWSEADARRLLSGLPQTFLKGVSRETADAAVKKLNAAGAKASLWIVPVGSDISRGWGKRRNVAEDYLYDYPVMLGIQRVGPDLANVGLRLPDQNWHLRHLYHPRLDVKNSTMPPYRFLFEKRKTGSQPSADALVLPPEAAPADGFEIFPRPEARALVAYLLSLRADAPLFQAPLTVAAASPAATNTPAPGVVSGTNAPVK